MGSFGEIRFLHAIPGDLDGQRAGSASLHRFLILASNLESLRKGGAAAIHDPSFQLE